MDSLDSDDSSQEHEIEGMPWCICFSFFAIYHTIHIGIESEAEETGGDDLEVADNDSDDDDDEDEDEEEEEEEDELVALRARREETQKPVERPIVLSKPSSKPRYNFIQEYISLRQNTLLPQTFRCKKQLFNFFYVCVFLYFKSVNIILFCSKKMRWSGFSSKIWVSSKIGRAYWVCKRNTL